jgi:DNA polymerase III epsilon subunit-like protein
LILCSLDFETTGVDTKNDHPIEFGGILYSTQQHKCLDNLGVLVKTDRLIAHRITKITGITKPALDRFGYESAEIIPLVIDMIQSADVVIGYNCRRFDRKIMLEWAEREGLDVPDKIWIDLQFDMPWEVPTCKLSHVAADHGILNLFPHSALADAQTVLAIAMKYDPNLLLQRAQSPIIILQAKHNRNENELVKQAPFKFRWHPTEKIWWKPVKEQDVNQVIEAAQFSIIPTSYTLDELEN